MCKKGYGQIQEARKGDLEKSKLFGGKELGQDQTLGARGGSCYHTAVLLPGRQLVLVSSTGTDTSTSTGTGTSLKYWHWY